MHSGGVPILPRQRRPSARRQQLDRTYLETRSARPRSANITALPLRESLALSYRRHLLPNLTVIMALLRTLCHRDLLRLVVLLAVVRALVLAATPAARPPPSRAWHRTREGPGDLETLSRGTPTCVPAGAGSAVPGGLGNSDRPRRTRRGRRAPSARRRGSRGSRQRDRQLSASNSGLLIGILNIQSLKPKLLELYGCMHHGRYDIMCLTETWLKPATPNRLLTLPGYHLHRTDRPDRRGYGGVALAARDGISVSPIKIGTTGDHSGSKLETLWTLVKPDSKRQFIMCTVYRPPRRNVGDIGADFADLEAQFQRVIIDYPRLKVFLCGDLNCDWLKAASDPSRRALSDFTTMYSLSQCVSSSTYSTGSLLDVFITNCMDVVRYCTTKFCHFSPHRFVRVIVNIPRFRPRPTTVRSRCFRRVDPELIIPDVLRADWRNVYYSPSVTLKWDYFLATFMPIIDAHAPLRNVKIRNPRAPVISEATKTLIRRRRAALAAHGHQSTVYKEANRAVRAAIRRDNRDDVARRIREDGRGSMWRHIGSYVSGKRGVRVLPDATADDLNQFFVGVGPRVAGEVRSMGATPELPCRMPRVGACAFVLTPLSLSQLRAVVFGVKCSSACGDDGVTIEMFRVCFDAVGEVLLHLVNSSIIQSEVPQSWKHSLVHPILKSGDPTNPSNYRPISIVPVIAKVVERAVHQQLYTYLSVNHLLSPNQHGFRPRHSTETALTSISDHILSAADQGEVSLLCLLDLSKCFDVIDHAKLLSKLSLHGIDTSWFSAYLRNHTQSVSLTDSLGAVKTSLPLPNSIGVFQGSSLGPLLYCVFANDLSLFAEDAVVVQYADDTQILVSGKKSEIQKVVSRMERALCSLDNWFRANGLKVNAAKTQLMLLGSPQNLRTVNDVNVKFRDQHLVPISEAKNLGLTFDRSLSWDRHVSIVTQRCFGVLTGLSHLRGHLPTAVLSALINALVFSQIRYCISVYGNGKKDNFRRIQKIINYAARVLFGRRKYDHVSDLLERLGWLGAEGMATYHTVCLTHKVRRCGEPEQLAAGLSTVAETRTAERCTRQDNLLSVPRSRTEMGRRRFACRGPTLYNALPRDLQGLPVPLFSRRVRRHRAAVPRAPD